MKRYNIKKHLFGMVSALLLLTSCESWLEVKMKDKILENALYENLEGYTNALNGIYAELNSPEIYGRNLTMGAIDVMGQYYDVLTPENHTMATFGGYNFQEAGYRSMFSSVWSKMYNLLANTNLLLENCNRSDAPLPGIMKGLVTGEAYALRAMLHFDLLRLFGPCYSETTRDTRVMPYMDASDRRIRPMLSAAEVLDLVLADLEKAASLLKGSDPVIEEGAKNGSKPEDLDNSLNYRQYRLNYYAVKALMARACLWGGDREKAATYAREVIEEAVEKNAWFPFVTKENALKEKQPDRIGSTEVLFGLYNTKRNDIYKGLFQKEVQVGSRLTLFGTYDEGRLRTMYGNENDIRFSVWQTGMVDTTEVLYCNRFETTGDPKNENMVPLMRTSELYLMLAECAATDGEAEKYINAVRYVRGALDIVVTPENRDALIAAEFAREMLGEGQLYLFYKRRAMTSIPDGQTKDGYMDMPLDNYVWLIPDSEIENRPKF